MTADEKDALTVKIYRQLVMQVDRETIFRDLLSGVPAKEAEACYKRAWATFDQLTAPTYRQRYQQHLAGFSLVAARSFSVADYKTALAAIEKSMKLTQYLEANEPDENDE